MSKEFVSETVKVIGDLGREFSDATLFLHESIAASAGLSGADHKYLSILMKHGPMTAGQLAEQSGLTTGAVTGVINRLEKRELVKREFDPEDRRKIIIVPQYQNAMALLGGIFAELQGKILALLATFSEDERSTIEKYLRESIKVMQEITQNLTAEK